MYTLQDGGEDGDIPNLPSYEDIVHNSSATDIKRKVISNTRHDFIVFNELKFRSVNLHYSMISKSLCNSLSFLSVVAKTVNKGLALTMSEVSIINVQ